MDAPHIPVLADEILEIFKNTKGKIIDCTLGFAGHSEKLLKNNQNIEILACDKDVEAIEFSKKRLEIYNKRAKIYKSDFANFLNLLSNDELKNVQGILADIGVSSLQLDKNERGFSIKSDALDMRMDKTQEKDAKFVVNFYPQEELARIFKEYGEIPNANFYANKIIKFRQNKQIESAKELAEIFGESHINKRSVSTAILGFQAIRIEVNDELGQLKNLLTNISKLAPKGAIFAIISFHSLEDRIIKNAFKEWEKSCICPEFALKCGCGNNHALGKIVTKKPITATSNEIAKNSRSSCAKLRVFKFKD